MTAFRAVAAAAFLFASLAHAEAPKAYQVTGEVAELTDDVVTVLKGKEKFEIARAEVKAEGELKKGAKVTVEYKMSATSITVKEAKKK